MLTPRPEDVLEAFKTDKVLAMLDAEEVIQNEKEAKRLAKIDEKIAASKKAIVDNERQIEQGVWKFYKYVKRKRHLRGFQSIQRRRNLRQRQIRMRIERRFLLQKAQEFRKQIRPNARPTPTPQESNTTTNDTEAKTGASQGRLGT